MSSSCSLRFSTRVAWLASCIVLLVWCAQAQAVRTALWTANGPVYASAVFGTHTGEATGGGIVFDVATVLLDRAYPRIQGTVYAVVSDGAGGWFVGGEFTTAGVARSNLLHLRPDRSVNAFWDPAPNGPVYALALSTDGAVLYAGGDFTHVGGAARARLAALDAVTGAPLAWNAGADAPVRALVLAPDGATLYVGGDFASVGGEPRQGLAAVATGDGSVRADWQADTNGRVLALLVAGDQVYAGGDFTTVAGQARNRLAALALADGTPSAWNPDADATVRALAHAGEGLLYVGGDFTSIGGEPRARLAALDLDAIHADRATAWNPGADGPVHALWLDGTLLYAAGAFTSAGGAVRAGLVVLDTNVVSGGATDWDAGLAGPGYALALADGRLFVGGGFDGATDQAALYLGGDFDYVGPVTGHGVVLAADPAQPGDDGLLAFEPVVDGPIHAVVPDGSGGWFIGGEFFTVGGVDRSHLAHIRADGSVDPSWDPSPNAPVRALAVAGGVVYAGGDFTAMGGQARSRIAALDAATGAVTAWNPGADATVRALVVAGGVVYAGGDFTAMGGQARSRIAALDAATGAVTAWNPGADATVRSLLVAGGVVYAGGDFTAVGGKARNRIAAVDAATGAVTAWNPDADGPVYALVLGSDGTTLYAGGDFTALAGGAVARARLAALDSTTNVTADIPTAWNPGADGPVYSLQLAGTTLYTGGDFTTLGGLVRLRLGALTADPADPLADAPTPWTPQAGDAVYALALDGTALYAGGAFESVGGVRRLRLAAFSLNDGAVLDWDPAADGPVYTLSFSPDGNALYAGGAFTAIGGRPRNRVAALDRRTGVANFWSPNADGPVYALEPAPDGSVIYAGGAFEAIGGEYRPQLAALRPNGRATPWFPDLAGSSAVPATAGAVYALWLEDEILYAGGDFATAGGTAHAGLVALDVTSATALDWSPQVQGVVRTLYLDAGRGTLYAGGLFTGVNGDSRNNAAAVDLETGLVTAWDPQPDGPVWSLALARDRTAVYAGGAFGTIGGQSRAALAALDVTTGTALDAWSPAADDEVFALRVAADGRWVYAAGRFAHVGEEPRQGLAALEALPLERQAPVTTPDPPGGFYNGTSNRPVALVCDDGTGAGCAATYYTLDGSTPTFQSPIYRQPIELTGDAQLRFFSVDALGNTETPGRADYVLELGAPRTTADPPSMVFSSRRLEVTLSCRDAQSGCAETYYSLDEDAPPSAFARYTGPIRITGNTVLRFYSVDGAGNREVVRREDYVSNYGGPGAVHPAALPGLLLWWVAVRLRRVRQHRGRSPHTRISSTVRYALAFLLAGGGLLAASQPLRAASQPETFADANGAVYALALSQNVLYVGGNFTALFDPAQVERLGLAAIDLDTGEVRAWRADVAGTVHALALSADGRTLYVGGDFTHIGGVARNHLAALDTTLETENVLDWNPDPDAPVRALALSEDGLVLYAGGDFTVWNAGGDAVSRPYLAALDSFSGTLLPWDPRPDAAVEVLQLEHGERLYAGGRFLNIGGAYRPYLARLHLGSGQADDWQPAPDGPVYALVLADGGRLLYAGGDFTAVDGGAPGSRNRAAALDTTVTAAGSIATAWNPDFDAAVRALALSGDESLVYAGGDFTLVGGTARNRLAAVTAAPAGGAVSVWDPGADQPVRVLATDAGGTRLYAGGDFADIAADPATPAPTGLARFPIAPPMTTASPPGGGYPTPQEVTLTCLDHDGNACSAVYLTADGSEPQPVPADLYDGSPIAITANTTLKFFGVDAEGNVEALRAEDYYIDDTAPQVEASLPSGLYGAAALAPVELRCDDGAQGSGCAAIRYTLDGSDPDGSALLYVSPLPLDNLVTGGMGRLVLRFTAFDRAGNQSAVQERIYDVDTVPPLVVASLPSGTYTGPQVVELICDDGPGSGCADMYYTTDNSPPSDGTVLDSDGNPIPPSPRYTGPLQLERATMLNVLVRDQAGNEDTLLVGIYAFTHPRDSDNTVGALQPWAVLLLGMWALLRGWLRRRSTGMGPD